MRFLFAICIGVAGTLGWQTYGDQVRETLAGAYPQLNWLAPHAAVAQTVVTTTGTAARSTDAQELSIRFADIRQRVDSLSQQLTATHDQMTRELTAKLAVAERDILDKIAAAQQPRPEATVRKPAQPAQAQAQR